MKLGMYGASNFDDDHNKTKHPFDYCFYQDVRNCATQSKVALFVALFLFLNKFILFPANVAAITVFCLYNSVGQNPREERVYRTKLALFSTLPFSTCRPK